MANDGEVSDKPQSLRRRLTNSIKRVMSIRSKKSSKSGTTSPSQGAVPSTPVHPTSPPIASADPAPSAPELGATSAPPPPPLSAASAAPVETSRAAESLPVVSPLAATRPVVYRSPSRTIPTMGTTTREKSRTPRATPTPLGSPPPQMTQAERAEALFKKYGYDININEYPFPVPTHPAMQRVYRPIRMKVRRTCHKCQTKYDAERECRTCGHRHCTACPRQPLRKSKPKDKGKGKEKLTTKPPTGHKRKPYSDPYGLILPNRWGGPDLVYKPIRQRVHRFCHRCQKGFTCEKICANCKHTRCKKCPRLPKKGNMPDEHYNRNDPDDSETDHPKPPRRTYRRPRLRVYWTCKKCYSTFIEKNHICPGCGSKREDTGMRDPPKKPRHRYHSHPHHSRYQSDDEVRILDDRLRQTTLTD